MPQIPDNHRNIKPIGRGCFETTCKACGDVSIVGPGDDLFGEVDKQSIFWPLCSKCYDGPRGTRQQVDDLLGRRESKDTGDHDGPAVG